MLHFWLSVGHIEESLQLPTFLDYTLKVKTQFYWILAYIELQQPKMVDSLQAF